MQQPQPTQTTNSSAPKSICFVVCYFGKCPPWISFYLHACRANPSVHFLIFSDCISPNLSAKNVTIISSTLAEINQLASKKLGIPITINRPYKLCDLKPAYGEIFEDYLTDFAFWGMTDLDIIYGSIEDFITRSILKKYDVINAFEDYIVGHFSIYRNEKPYRSLFRYSHDYQMVFQAETMYSFAECGKQWFDFSAHRNMLDAEATIDSMTHVINRLSKEEKLSSYFTSLVRDKPALHKKNWLLCWDHGRLIDIDANEEIMYFHFHLFKQNAAFKIPIWDDIPDTFYINSHGFFR